MKIRQGRPFIYHSSINGDLSFLVVKVDILACVHRVFLFSFGDFVQTFPFFPNSWVKVLFHKDLLICVTLFFQILGRGYHTISHILVINPNQYRSTRSVRSRCTNAFRFLYIYVLFSNNLTRPPLRHCVTFYWLNILTRPRLRHCIAFYWLNISTRSCLRHCITFFACLIY